MNNSLGKISLYIGKSRDYLYVLKSKYKYKYDFYMSFDDDKLKSCIKAENELNKLLFEYQQMFIDIEHSKEEKEFKRVLREKNIMSFEFYNTEKCRVHSISKINIQSINRIKEILKVSKAFL